MTNLSQRSRDILSILIKTRDSLSSSQIHSNIIKSGGDVSLVTIKRVISALLNKKLLKKIGLGRSTSYSIGSLGRIFSDIDYQKYCEIEPDNRYGLKGYNFELFPSFPFDIFSKKELDFLENATQEYKDKTRDLPEAIRKKEFERLTIELSWKSSKIEGNTYTLLETEKLIKEEKMAIGKTKEDAQMILNHKNVLNYIFENKNQFKKISRKNLEDIHSILVKDLDINNGFRNHPVGIVGSIYKPLDNIYQIAEAVDVLIDKVNKMKSPYDKSLLALLGIAYIQPFEDGNKRTSRLLANALLVSYGLMPLSYRSVDEDDYRKAMITFYELNSVGSVKNIFIEQYDFATKNYSI